MPRQDLVEHFRRLYRGETPYDSYRENFADKWAARIVVFRYEDESTPTFDFEAISPSQGGELTRDELRTLARILTEYSEAWDAVAEEVEG